MWFKIITTSENEFCTFILFLSLCASIFIFHGMVACQLPRHQKPLPLFGPSNCQYMCRRYTNSKHQHTGGFFHYEKHKANVLLFCVYSFLLLLNLSYLKVNLLAARNERESVQVAIRPKASWGGAGIAGLVQVQCSDLCSSSGDRLVPCSFFFPLQVYNYSSNL